MLLKQAEARNTPINFGKINKTLAKALTEGSHLTDLLKAKIDEAASTPGGLLLLTDLEALHPYLRINSIEPSSRHDPLPHHRSLPWQAGRKDQPPFS
jgi:hypothetical protein